MEQERISPEQIRAARALLGMSQADLADRAKLSSMTIKRAEGIGSVEPSTVALDAIQKTLEEAGVVFIPENGGGAGVRLRK